MARRSARDYAQFAIQHALSERSQLRGRYRRDGRITLLTVDFNVTEHVLRLISTFHAHVDPQAPVIVVQNGSRSQNARLRAAGARVAGFGLNIGHAMALDYGLSKVKTQYVLVCDPDAVVVSDQFRAEILRRLESYGVAGIVISDAAEHQRYHPICTAFDMRLWKRASWTMQENYPEYDVGGALTRHLGGLEPAAVLPRTRGGNNGVVWAECFSNTYGISRIRDCADDDIIDGNSAGSVRRYHRRWTDWAVEVAAGRAGVEAFPEPEGPQVREAGGS